MSQKLKKEIKKTTINKKIQERKENKEYTINESFDYQIFNQKNEWDLKQSNIKYCRGQIKYLIKENFYFSSCQYSKKCIKENIDKTINTEPLLTEKKKLLDVYYWKTQHFPEKSLQKKEKKSF